MATYTDFGTISKDAGFQSRVNYAMMLAAEQIYNEAITTAGHPTRSAYALRVIAGSFNLQAVSSMVLTDSTVSAAASATVTPLFGITDAQISNAVSGIWNSLAGV